MSENKMSERRLAELSKKNLHRADLTWQVLIGANFGRARLSYANLSYANLSYANLCEADLIEAKLYNTNLTEAELSRAKLNGADFCQADTTGADFRNTDLSAVKNLTMSQIRAAKVDETTRLPRNLKQKMPKKRTHDSVVLIMSFDSNNQPLAIRSGFYVDDGTKIATIFHVISGSQVVRVKNPDGKEFKANFLLGVDSKHDLAILEADVPGKPILLSQRTPEIGEDIIAIGNPKGLDTILSKGIVSGVRNYQDSILYQVTAPISPGSSGGPIINARGEVIGVSTFYVQGGQNLNFAVPSAYIHRLLKSPSRVALE
ncbi:MAG: pentapeptide repeat-containing protein [Nitrospinae bacterium]|nr:pentapeptide repeat-containing protein [Nitrospinota bacterium]